MAIWVRRAAGLGCALVLTCGVALAQSEGGRRYELHIPAQPLGDALKRLAAATDTQLLFSDADVMDRTSPTVDGSFDMGQALGRLLVGSGLSYRLTGNSIVVTRNAALQQRSDAVPAMRPAGPRATPPDVLEEIIVTSRRLSENLQVAPLSVSSLSGDLLREQNITRVQQVSNVTPNIIISDAPSNGMGTIVYLRGIGQIAVTSYSDPPVSIYVDGVVQARPTGNAFDLPDIDHVEVLRGPQGTLFGRNTTGGAIAIYTKRPSDKFGGSAKIGYGKDNEFTSNLVLNTGRLFDSTLRSKLTFQRRAYDGWVDTPSRPASSAAGYYRNTGASLALAADVGDALTIDNRLDYTKLNTRPAYQAVLADASGLAFFGQSAALGGPPFLLSPKPLDKFYLDPRLPYDPFAKAWGDTLTLTYDASPALQLKSITGYRHLDQSQTGQIGGSYTVGPIVNPPNPTQPVVPTSALATPLNTMRQHQISQEFQAQGKSGDFTYAAGLYYFHEKADEVLDVIVSAIVAPGLGFNAEPVWHWNVRSTSYAGYAQAGWRPSALDDRLEVTGGLRYTVDKRGENTAQSLNGAALGTQAASKSWHNLGWSSSVSYQFLPSVMGYFRASSGYRAGGFDPLNLGAPAYNPEKATSIEAGLKSKWADGRLLLNGVLFKTFYSDLQILQRDAAVNTNFTTNAAKADYSGFELESVAVLGSGFQLDGTVGFVDPEYRHYFFKDASGALVDLAGAARFPFVSKWTANIGGQFRTPVDRLGTLTLRLDLAYKSAHFFQPIDALSPNNAFLGSGVDRNLRAHVTLSDLPVATGTLSNVQVQLYGENLLNNRFKLSAVDSVQTASASFNRPRSYGVLVSAEF